MTSTRRFIAGLGAAQVVSWGTLYYSFPLIAKPMAAELGLSKPAAYGAATVGLLVAGIAAFPLGAAIDRGWGRSIMTLGSLLACLALLAWAAVGSLPSLYLAFVGIGLAQAMTLYEPAFAVIARRFGANARQGIVTLSLWGGFAGTVFIPLIGMSLNHVGWRATLAILAAANLFCVLLHGWVIDPGKDAPRPAPPVGHGMARQGRAAAGWALRQPAFRGLLVALTVYYGLFSALIFHLYPLLLEQGFSDAAAAASVAAIGPAQVVARIVLLLVAGQSPIRAVGSATVAVFPIALALLLAAPGSPAMLVAFTLLFGGANGLMTIVRGLAVSEMVTRDAYGAVNGTLAAPGIAVKALAPLAAALLWTISGSYQSLVVVALSGTCISALAFWYAATRRI
ncbi:MFS transporter [Azospirillum sp. Sh1]|uniref:MFS transporter n=1 Tax=Azospirillum sp. Sh1 TaxID=2607285 RepID=UPI0011F05F8E|nr:MFS transporter [Azospirillum sp. Sh1]KAA0570231.1 MFS transporter [Azospirillum sp. Sh1]